MAGNLADADVAHAIGADDRRVSATLAAGSDMDAAHCALLLVCAAALNHNHPKSEELR